MRPAAPVAMPASIGAFELEPFDDELCPEPLRLCEEPDEPLLRVPDDERDAPEDERLLDALRVVALLAFVVERGLLFDELPLLDAFEPFELCVVRFLLLDELVFACAISPPWVFDSFAAEIGLPR